MGYHSGWGPDYYYPGYGPEYYPDLPDIDQPPVAEQLPEYESDFGGMPDFGMPDMDMDMGGFDF